MAKRTAHSNSVKQTNTGSSSIAQASGAGQGTASEKLWLWVAAAFGGLVTLSFLSPADSVSVFMGTALPQNLGWLGLASIAALAGRGSATAIRLSRVEWIAILGGLCWLIGVTCLAAPHGNGRAVWNGFWQVMSLASCFYIGRALVAFERVRNAMILVLVVGCTALSIEGLEQVFVSMPADRAAYYRDPDRMLADQGIDAPAGSTRRKQFEDRLNSPEPFATFALANSLATLLCLGVVLNGGLLANALMGVKPSHVSKVFMRGRILALTLSLFAQLLCVLLTRSRTAYIAIALSLAVWLALTVLRRGARLSGGLVRIAAVAILALGLSGLGWLFTIDRLVWSEAPKSISFRLEYWQATLAMIRDHVWTGVGFGNFQAYYPQYKFELASETISDPHNWILDIAASLSVPVAMLLIIWLIFGLTKGWRLCFAEDLTLKTAALHIASRDELRWAKALLFGAAAGGAIGLVSTLLLGLTRPLDLAVSGLAWGLAAAVGWSAWSGGQIGATSVANRMSAITGVLLCQLASGSWQASGISMPLLVLLAMFWRHPDHSVASLEEPRPIYPVERRAGWGSLALAMAALAIFVLQTWRPVTQSWMWQESASAASSMGEQQRAIELASAADPLNSELQLQRIQMLTAVAVATADDTVFVERGTQIQLELNRLSSEKNVNYLVPKVAGDVSLQWAASAAQRGLDNKSVLMAARGFYSQAVARYPSSVELLVQLAAASALIEDWTETAKSIERALEISERTPHTDKQLATQTTFLPLKLPGYESSSDYIPAEPLANWLRTEAKEKLR